MQKKKGRKANGSQKAVDYPFEPWREKLRAAIVVSKQSRRGLSLNAGLKQGYIRDVIAPPPGKKPADPTISRLHKLVNALDLTLNDLFEEGELNSNDLLGRMAYRGLHRVFSQIADLSPEEQAWMFGAIEQQLELLDKIPTKKQLKTPQLRILRPED